MARYRISWPSPSMLVAMAALVVAIGGSAFAGATPSPPTAETAKKAKPKRSSDTAADTKLIRKLAPKLTVKAAKTATSAGAANTANHATDAVTATNATSAQSLQGLAPGSFVQGGGHEYSAQQVIGANGTAPLIDAPGIATVLIVCSGTSEGRFEVSNHSGARESVEVNSASEGNGVGALFDGATTSPLTPASTDDVATIQVMTNPSSAGPFKLATFVVSVTSQAPNGCLGAGDAHTNT